MDHETVNVSQDYYAVLGVDPRADQATIKRAAAQRAEQIKAALQQRDYRALRVAQGASREIMREAAQARLAEIKQAYAVLGHPEKRAPYDEAYRETKRQQQLDALKSELEQQQRLEARRAGGGRPRGTAETGGGRFPIPWVWLVAGGMVLALAGWWFWGGDDAPPPEARTVAASEEGIEDYAAVEDAGERDAYRMVNGLRDEGEVCETHRYVIPAGRGGLSLSFSREHPNRKPEVYSYRARPERQAALAARGVEVGFSHVYYEEVETHFPVWVADGGLVLSAARAAPDYENDWNGIPNNIPVSHRINDVQIRWRDDGYLVLEKLGAAWSAEAVGQLSEKDLREKLKTEGDSPVLFYRVGGDTHTLYLERGRGAKTVKLQTLEFVVGVPENLDSREHLPGAEFLPDGGSGRGLGLGIHARHHDDPDKLSFVFVGPAKSRECFETG